MTNKTVIFILSALLSCSERIDEAVDHSDYEVPAKLDPYYPRTVRSSSIIREIEKVNLQRYTGKGVTIAVSDSGIETLHEDLHKNMLKGKHRKYYKENNNLYVEYMDHLYSDTSESDHGTNVIGIANAMANNPLGSRGIAYEAKSAAFDYLEYSHYFGVKTDQFKGDFDIFNYSYSRRQCRFAPYETSEFIKTIKEGVTKNRDGRGSIYIKSAGNFFIGKTKECLPESDKEEVYFGNSNSGWMNNLPYVITVAATDESGFSASYSSVGSSIWISTVGGNNIVTTSAGKCDEDENYLDEKCKYTDTFTGTSAAAPIVSGVVALMLQANPLLTWRDVKYILARTAKLPAEYTKEISKHPGIKRGNKGVTYSLEGHTYLDPWITNAAGYDFHNWHGFGNLAPTEAIKMAENYHSKLGKWKETPWITSEEISLPIPDHSSSGVEHIIEVFDNMTIEALQVKVNIAHKKIGQLGLELAGPSETKSILMHINSHILGSDMVNIVLSSNAFFMENAKGNWRLKVIDGTKEIEGTLIDWSIKIYGHIPSSSRSPDSVSTKKTISRGN